MSSPVMEATQTEFPYFTEEHHMLRETVKKFAQHEIATHSEEWDEAGIFPKELFKKAADLGLFGIRLDPKYSVAYNGRGAAYSNNGNYQKAIADKKLGILL